MVPKGTTVIEKRSADAGSRCLARAAVARSRAVGGPSMFLDRLPALNGRGSKPRYGFAAGSDCGHRGILRIFGGSRPGKSRWIRGSRGSGFQPPESAETHGKSGFESTVLVELRRDSSYLKMGENAGVAGADREAPAGAKDLGASPLAPPPATRPTGRQAADESYRSISAVCLLHRLGRCRQRGAALGRRPARSGCRLRKVADCEEHAMDALTFAIEQAHAPLGRKPPNRDRPDSGAGWS